MHTGCSVNQVTTAVSTQHRCIVGATKPWTSIRNRVCKVYCFMLLLLFDDGYFRLLNFKILTKHVIEHLLADISIYQTSKLYITSIEVHSMKPKLILVAYFVGTQLFSLCLMS